MWMRRDERETKVKTDVKHKNNGSKNLRPYHLEPAIQYIYHDLR